MNKPITRRNLLKTGGIVVASSSMFTIKVVGETDSGFVELDVDATIPTDTGAYIRIYEDNSGDGNADRNQQKEITDGLNTYEYDALAGYEGQGIFYWLSIDLQTNDGNITPEINLNNLTLTLPAETGATNPESTTWEDTFEDGFADGWINQAQDLEPDAVEESIAGNWSLFAETTELNQQDRPVYDWIEGPNLDMREYFYIEGIVKHNYVTSNKERQVRLGITGDDQNATGENAFLLFDGGNNETYLGNQANASSSEGNIINTSFENEWVNFILQSNQGSNTIDAKVWDYDAQEPENWNLSLSGLEGINGYFSVNPGLIDETHRRIWLDEVYIEGEVYVPDDEEIRIESRGFIEPDESISYEILFKNESGEWIDVTDDENLSLTSENSGIVDVNTQENQFEAISKGETLIYAEYDGFEKAKEISVGEVTIGDIDLLPPSKKLEAVFTDKTSQVIFASTIGSLFINKLMTAYDNSKNTWISLGTAFAVIMLAGFQGWVSNGIVFAALFFVIISSLIISNVRQNEVSVVNQE